MKYCVKFIMNNGQVIDFIPETPHFDGQFFFSEMNKAERFFPLEKKSHVINLNNVNEVKIEEIK